MKLPRGIINSNPGNIRHSSTKWLGEVPGTDTSFKTFKTPTYGLRAIALLLLNYERNYKLNTVRGLIDRWAPPVENDTDTYVKFVASAAGVAPDAHIHVVDHLPALVKAIVTMENGQCPYEASVINRACQMAEEGK